MFPLVLILPVRGGAVHDRQPDWPPSRSSSGAALARDKDLRLIRCDFVDFWPHPDFPVLKSLGYDLSVSSDGWLYFAPFKSPLDTTLIAVPANNPNTEPVSSRVQTDRSGIRSLAKHGLGNTLTAMFKISGDSLEFAREHIERYGDTDVLPAAFEHAAIRDRWDDVRKYLCEEDLDNWQVGPSRKSLAPKGPLGFRIATQLDPLDTLLLTALVHEAGTAIEAARIHRDEQVVLSHRFDPEQNGRLYSKEFTFETFRRRSLELASERENAWVVLTDIADFYPRLYSHPLENALNQSVHPDHARVLTKLIKKWNYGVSYGIPVGPAASRLLAELSITDVDSTLLGEDIAFCRYSDDFRLFAGSREAALKALALLANVLHVNHGLTLQEAKTRVLPADQFTDVFKQTDEQRERLNLETNFYGLLEDLGIDTYEHIEYDDLEPEQQKAIDALNLADIVHDQITRDQPLDIALTGFALRRLVQVRGVDEHLADTLLNKIDRMTVVFREVLEAVSSSEEPGTARYVTNRERLLALLGHPSLAHLEYYRMWILSQFHNSDSAALGGWQGLYGKMTDALTRRELVLAMGYEGNQGWLRSKKQGVFEFGDWERRAYLFAASCLPSDERNHWYNSLTPRLNRLEQWVVGWAKSHPIK